MQTIKSAKTSQNQIPALFRKLEAYKGTTVIDIGGGKYDRGINYLVDQYGMQAAVYDPFNRTEDHNRQVLENYAGMADLAVCCNVLNVINCKDTRKDVAKRCRDWTKDQGTVIFQVYQGNGSGVPKETTKGYQLNRKAADYIPELKEVFSQVKRSGNTITCTTNR